MRGLRLKRRPYFFDFVATPRDGQSPYHPGYGAYEVHHNQYGRGLQRPYQNQPSTVTDFDIRNRDLLSSQTSFHKSKHHKSKTSFTLRPTITNLTPSFVYNETLQSYHCCLPPGIPSATFPTFHSLHSLPKWPPSAWQWSTLRQLEACVWNVVDYRLLRDWKHF